MIDATDAPPLSDDAFGDEALMRRAVALARRGDGRVSPNPPVGCVLVSGDRIVGEGWHEGPGTDHAEVAAIKSAGAAARGARAFVTLEPCNHQGRTGPCTDALIAAGVADVIYGAEDPNPTAAGGAARLRSKGVSARMASGAAKEAADDLTRAWRRAIVARRPYVYAKYACSLDGRTATRTGSSKWITGEKARHYGHVLRQRTDAVIVGVGTVVADNPSLDPRPPDTRPAPGLKVICDSALRTPTTARVFNSPGETLIFCSATADGARERALTRVGASVIRLDGPDGRPPFRDVLVELRRRNCLSAMIEGGSRLLGAAFDDALVDEVWAFIAPVIVGGGQPVVNGHGALLISDALRLQAPRIETIGDDLFIRGYATA
ncbi:MAG: bifunctional diaminohydroxyphosphoribosylaminopyrimidine deaminase/5-amino-6-(5-phosphoribosylamino)uracil reductase RibD [Pseudomonadota bacterium]